MKKVKFLLVAICCIAASLVAMTASANLNINENFEGTAAFVDQNWPITGTAAAGNATVAKTLQMGTNIAVFAWHATNPTSQLGMTDPHTIVAYTGTLTTDRHFAGAKSLQLASGQSANVTNGYQGAGGSPDWMWTYQFAISCDAASAALPAGTQIGHFTLNYSTAGVTNPVFDNVTAPNDSMNIVLKTNAAGKVDVISSKDSVKIGELAGDATSGKATWALITIVVIPQTVLSTDKSTALDTAAPWICFDSILGKYKGPLPLVATPDPGVGTDYVNLPTGINIFVNSNTAADVMTRAGVLGAGFGNQDPTNAAGATAHHLWDFGFDFAAENGGKIFIDDVFVSHRLFGELNYTFDGYIDDVAATRLDAFNQPSNEGKVAAAGPSWMLY